MGSYAYTVICTAIVCKLFVCLSPEGEDGKLYKYLAFTAALITTVVMLSPVVGFITSDRVDTFDGYDFSTKAENSISVGEYYAQSAKSILCEVYGCSEDSVLARVTCYSDGNVKKLEMKVSGGDLDENEAGKILTEIFGFETVVRREE